jgi:hypothetical protein
VSTCALICLCTFDGWVHVLDFDILVFLQKTKEEEERPRKSNQNVPRMFIQMKVDGNKPLQIICLLFAFVFLFGLCMSTCVLISLVLLMDGFLSLIFIYWVLLHYNNSSTLAISTHVRTII